MLCPKCQADNPVHAAFCDQCGARLDKACPHCGESNRYGAKFCRTCGQTITESVTTSSATIPGVPAPDTYVPKYLAEKILASRNQLEGERKQVTVLFADIRGSTKLLEKLDPEEGQQIIDPVLRIMMDAVHKYEGTVNQVLGDGVMALFGAPLAHEDHALRACYAALAMQEEMHRYREKLGQSEETGLQIGVGMNSGEVVVRSIDNDLNIDYSALGHTTHLAARMQELSGPGEALISASTFRQVEGFVEVQPLGPVQVKGVSHPVEIYSVIGVTTARTRVQAGAARGLTPLVGRTTEIDIFHKLVERVSGGRGQILAMIGEPGVGKSRLVHEFTRHQLSSDWLVLEATSVSYGKATAYFPLVEMLRRYFAIAHAEDNENIRRRVITHILELDSRLIDTIPPILSLLDALPDAKTSMVDHHHDWAVPDQEIDEVIRRFNSMDPQQRRTHTLDAPKRICLRESRRQNLLLVFEDLHWIDHETQSFLNTLVDSLPMARLLLLVNYRPEYNHEWSEKSYYTQLRVDPLQTGNAEELLSKLLGSNPELAPLKQLLAKRTEGNPFFAEESVRGLVESGVLTGEKGAYRPGLKTDNLVIPSTVQNVVADRIDRLPAEEKHLLQIAAVIGVIVPFELLHAVAELPDEQLFQYLDHLKSAEFIYESNLFPGLEYTFRHALTNEVSYGTLLRERRIFLHAKITAALEQIANDNLYDYIEAIAQHAYRGELWNKAVKYLGQAGNKAMSVSAFMEALSTYEQALDAVQHVPDSREKLETQIDLHLDVRNVLFLLGDLVRLAEHLHEAQALAETLGDNQRLARVLNFLNSYYGLAGDPERAIEVGKRALTLTRSSEDPATGAVARYYLGAAYNKTGQYKEAIEVLQQGMRIVDGKFKYERFGTALVLSVICRSHLVQCLSAIGDFNEAARCGEEGVRLAEEVNHAASLVHMNCSLGVMYLLKGQLQNAIEIFDRSLRICHSSNVPVYIPYVASRLGAAYANAGRISDAIPYLEEGVENSAAAGRVAFLALSTMWLSEGYLLSGRLEDARKVGLRALELSRTHKERGHEAWVLKLLGDIALRYDPPNTKEAEAYYCDALSLSNLLGMRPLQAHCRYGLGHILIKTGPVDHARSETSTAVDLYRAMEMRFWLNQAEVALRSVDPSS